MANVQDGCLELKEITYIRIPVRHKLQYGDVLMNEGGDFDKLGRGTVWRDEAPNLSKSRLSRPLQQGTTFA